MRLSSNLAFLTLVSQGLVALAAPIEFAETSELLDLKGSENPRGFDAREVSSDLEAREWDESEELSVRDLADFELSLRSLSDDNLLPLEARQFITNIVGQIGKKLVGPLKKRIHPGKGSPKTPKPNGVKKLKSKGLPKTGKKSSGLSKPGKSSKKGSVAPKKKPKNLRATGGSGKRAGAKGKKEASKKKKSQGSSRKGSGKGKKGNGGKGKNGGGKDKGKKSGKKGATPSRTRNRTFNVNLDPGTLLNAGAAIANVVTGLGN
ncbi:hypothetical protein FA13DRAFT_1817000 [Coprinellus micaceus]|uniref:Uncharacterized protein n=1 Tax=Coprinellus micaceus TaxID=71717 RepID=A0A4Y7SWY3_COPMI|nr:hypothetical protein FA13DRAFT_1817000 [Coprinellus micaceus]